MTETNQFGILVSSGQMSAAIQQLLDKLDELKDAFDSKFSGISDEISGCVKKSIPCSITGTIDLEPVEGIITIEQIGQTTL